MANRYHRQTLRHHYFLRNEAAGFEKIQKFGAYDDSRMPTTNTNPYRRIATCGAACTILERKKYH